jgi:YfiH family protein
MMNIYPFNLEFINNSSGNPVFAPFPFIFNGKHITGISCGISSRYAKDMKDEKNRENLFAKLSLNPANVYALKQIHSRSVLFVDGANPPSQEADGMVTTDAAITLSVTVADCLPIFLLDTKSGAFALVHSGWKGTGIAANALDLMKDRLRINNSDIAVILGPCISSCCYKVDEQRASLFEKEFGRESVRKISGEYFLDLKKTNITLLEKAGVGNIAVCENCTFCDKRLGSFRREGSQFTHMIALANINSQKVLL